jgi:predicted ABC-type ATPase
VTGRLIVVTGPPGAGKTTVSQLLAEHFDPSVLVVGDYFFAFLARGAIPPWTPEARHQNDVVVETAAQAAGSFVRGGYATIYEGIVGPWYLAAFAAATGLHSLDYVVLMPAFERCRERVLTRAEHGFRDEPATRHMYEQFSTAQVDERHVVRDPPEGAEEVAAEVLALIESGRCAYEVPVVTTGEQPGSWLTTSS